MASRLNPFFAGLTLVLLAFGMHQALVATPPDATLGDAQRILYLHRPAAVAGLLMFLCNFIASLTYLRNRSQTADAWAVAAAEVGVVLATVFLISGSIWSRYVSYVWWTWDLRPTTALILWLLYVSYLMLRRSAEAGSVSVMAAVLAVFAFLDVPMAYVVNRWFRDNPPPMTTGNGLTPAMQFALMANVIGFLAFAALLCWFRYSLERREQKIDALHRQKATAGTLVLALPAIAFFQPLNGTRSVVFMYAGYIAVWSVYLGYIALLVRRMRRLKAEETGLGFKNGN
ncbi:MAG TPA: cytochrome c biogenesis protein [Candidatus Saccharimonadales bacterium]|jgi:heme exporter protein C|nr:cytochrome c biogenesis protein [Candidatus Saccharimonadales bacterium]